MAVFHRMYLIGSYDDHESRKGIHMSSHYRTDRGSTIEDACRPIIAE